VKRHRQIHLQPWQRVKQFGDGFSEKSMKKGQTDSLMSSYIAHHHRISKGTIDVHPSMLDFLKHLESTGSSPKALYKYSHNLIMFWRWLQTKNVEPAQATAADLFAYQRWLSESYRTPKGGRLLPASQVRRLTVVRTFYKFLARRGVLLVNIAKNLKLPKAPRHTTQRDYFTLQEITALLQTQAKRVAAIPRNKLLWSIEMRNLALYCLAVATGRRYQGLRDLKVADLNFKLDEIRVDYEKGRTGRVLPVAHWAMVVAKEYIETARPRFKPAAQSPFLFVSKRNGSISHQADDCLPVLLRQTVEENPDLTELPSKTLTMHGFRVTFAKLLFNGGCNLRSVNELMLHERLSTTAYYTPLKLEELRMACRLAHPRA